MAQWASGTSTSDARVVFAGTTIDFTVIRRIPLSIDSIDTVHARQIASLLLLALLIPLDYNIQPL